MSSLPDPSTAPTRRSSASVSISPLPQMPRGAPPPSTLGRGPPGPQAMPQTAPGAPAMPILISAPSKAGPAAVAQQSSVPSGPASAISPLVPMSSSSRQPGAASGPFGLPRPSAASGRPGVAAALPASRTALPLSSSPVSPQASIPAVRSPPKYPAAQGQSQTCAPRHAATPQPSGRSAPNSETGV